MGGDFRWPIFCLWFDMACDAAITFSQLTQPLSLRASRQKGFRVWRLPRLLDQCSEGAIDELSHCCGQHRTIVEKLDPPIVASRRGVPVIGPPIQRPKRRPEESTSRLVGST